MSRPLSSTKKKARSSTGYTRHYRPSTGKKNNESVTYPMRLSRFLALTGQATRREADELIASGVVWVDGKKAVLGQKVDNNKVKVEIRRKGGGGKEYRYIAYYKPRGVVTHTPKKGEQDIRQASGFEELFPVGRLDKDSEGLIILTNDGRVTERLLHPRFLHEKEYIVSLDKVFTPKSARVLQAGVESAGEKLTLKRVQIFDPYTVSVILTEGKKHQVRRMLEGVGYNVTRLVRIRIMDVHLGNLKEGKSRELTGKAKKAFLQSIGLI